MMAYTVLTRPLALRARDRTYSRVKPRHRRQSDVHILGASRQRGTTDAVCEQKVSQMPATSRYVWALPSSHVVSLFLNSQLRSSHHFHCRPPKEILTMWPRNWSSIRNHTYDRLGGTPKFMSNTESFIEDGKAEEQPTLGQDQTAVGGRSSSISTSRIQQALRLVLAAVGVVSLWIVLITAWRTTLHPVPRAARYERKTLTCGNTTAEAEARGCAFDILSHNWVAPACLDPATGVSPCSLHAYQTRRGERGSVLPVPDSLPMQNPSTGSTLAAPSASSALTPTISISRAHSTLTTNAPLRSWLTPPHSSRCTQRERSIWPTAPTCSAGQPVPPRARFA